MDAITTLSRKSASGDCMFHRFAFEHVIDDLCRLPWATVDADDLTRVAKAYYYFSIQFRENLDIAVRIFPNDQKLQQLYEGECNTDNLSPWPDVAEVGEKLNHDEFIRRLLLLQPIEQDDYLTSIGRCYLDRIRELDDMTRAKSLASYEDGGLSGVFLAILRASDWQGAGPRAFRFFLEQHILFDSDDAGAHGALSRHLSANDDILPLWIAFRELLVAAVPRFWQTSFANRASNRRPLEPVAI